MTHRIFSFSFVVAMLLLTMSAAMQDRFPDGPGKDELLKLCSGCHEPENVFAHPQTAAEWSETVMNMVQLGAEGTPEEFRLVEQYLHKNLALITINSAAADELQRTMDVTEQIAAAIVKYRQQNGKFKSLDDLKKVPGLEAAKVDARKDRLIF